MEQKSQNERIEINEAFSDLDTLMTKAKDLVEIAEKFKLKVIEQGKKSSNNNNNNSDGSNENIEEEENEMQDLLLNLGLTSPVTKQSSGAMYHKQLCRQLVDFLDHIIHDKYNGVITLTDAYCLYNRARGMDLISPEDLMKACQLFEPLNLPMKLKKFESGVIVIQSSKYSDEEMIQQIESIINEQNDKCITAVTLAQKLKISIVLAREILHTAEQNQSLCRDETEEALSFYLVSHVFDPYLNQIQIL
jgi:ESCRT-II complex subunit VPS36